MQPMHPLTALAWSALSTVLLVASAQGQTADTVFTNGKIYTVNEAQPLAEAVAIADRKFVKIGSNADIKPLIGPNSKLVDLGGAFAMPGIIDPHMHPFEDYQREIFLLNIEDNSSPEAIVAAVKAYADANSDKTWIVGGIWPTGMFPGENPSRELLDAVVPDRPVFILDQSAHSVWLNTKALEVAGFMSTPQEKLPKGSVVMRDENGVPTGTVREYAIGFLRRSMPETSLEEWAETGRLFQKLFHSLGITSVKAAAGTKAHSEAVKILADGGEWKLRLKMAMNYNYFDSPTTLDEQIEEIKGADQFVSEFFDPRGFKIFLDGAPPTREGWVIDPYPGTKDNYGVGYYQPDKLKALYVMATDINRTVMSHAIGDRAVREVLNAIEAARRARPESILRHHPTHNSMARLDDIKRFKALGLTLEYSPNLNWTPSLINLGNSVLGPEVFADYGNGRRALDAGAELAYASDWAVAPLDPWARIGYVVSRVNPDFPEIGQFNAASAVTPEEAIRASTLGPAHVIGVEMETGSIEVGKFADMIVLDRDITTIPATGIKDVKVMLTVFAGEVVYEAE